MKHFISILGTGNYKDINYSLDNFVADKTPYIQEALGELLFNNDCSDVKYTIFCTNEAKEKHWQILHDRLKNKGIICEFTPPIIPVGENEDQLWEIFNTICDNVNDGDELYIDITHSLRNIPLQMIAAIYFAKASKKVTLEGIYYGAYELKQEEGSSLKAPVFDLKNFINVMELSFAAEEFIKYGKSDRFYSFYKSSAKELFNSNQLVEGFSTAVSRLNDFTNCFETARGKKTTSNTGSIYCSCSTFFIEMKKLNANEKETKGFVKTAVSLLNCAEKNLIDSGFCEENDDTEIGLATVKWAIKHNNTQLGYTALEETITTWLCKINNADANSRETRDEIKRLYHKDDMEKRIETGKDKLLNLISDVSNNRNNINHFGFNANEMTYAKLNKALSDNYKTFLEIIDDSTNNPEEYK